VEEDWKAHDLKSEKLAKAKREDEGDEEIMS